MHDSWNISLNIAKTKVVEIRKGSKLLKNHIWFFNKNPDELVNSFNYLIMTFRFNGKFHLTRTEDTGPTR